MRSLAERPVSYWATVVLITMASIAAYATFYALQPACGNNAFGIGRLHRWFPWAPLGLDPILVTVASLLWRRRVLISLLVVGLSLTVAAIGCFVTLWIVIGIGRCSE